ncbi:MAG: ATP-binding protein [Cyclobacteriaceae bacterium]|nr:ATP-binding protein [Cyclobacteriaceae bacterium]
MIANNLISNAIKYQHKNKAEKKIWVNGNIDKKSAELSISDNGIGIDAAYQDSIFKMFYRASTLSVGSGLGLFLVKESVNKVDGEISVSSVPNEGTTFYLSIPNNLSSILKQCDLIRCDTLIFDCRLFWHEGISNKS